MNTQQQQVATRAPDAVVVLRNDLEKMKEQFQFALPAHIPPARFIRVVMTAVQNNPKLLKCTRQSLFNACMKCAQDGLLPDGREAALVPYGDDSESGQSKADIAQYLPMIGGIRKKVRNSGMLRDWNVQVVQQGDQFDYQLGDDPFIHHKPSPTGGRTRAVLFAYSIATYPDGTKSREVMNADQIKDVQSKAKAKRGPWSDPIFYAEMCRKTVAKLHAKQLPMSTDLDTVLRRDDELYDFKAERERVQRANDAKPPPSVGAALDIFGAEPQESAQLTQETTQLTQEPTQNTIKPPASSSANEQQELAPGDGLQPAQGGGQQDRPTPAAAAPPPPADDPIATARKLGYEANVLGVARKAIPGELRAPERSKEAQAWQVGWDNANNTKGGGSGPAGTAALIVFATLATLAMSFVPAFACVTDYRSLPADHGWRHYRVIAGEHCWYVGRHGNAVADVRPSRHFVTPKVGHDAYALAGNAAAPRPEPPAEPVAFDDRWTDATPAAVPIHAIYFAPAPEPAPPPRSALINPGPLAVLAAVLAAGLVLAVRPSLLWEARRRRDARWRCPPIRDLNREGWT
jgi:recombination protein RecT